MQHSRFSTNASALAMSSTTSGATSGVRGSAASASATPRPSIVSPARASVAPTQASFTRVAQTFVTASVPRQRIDDEEPRRLLAQVRASVAGSGRQREPLAGADDKRFAVVLEAVGDLAADNVAGVRRVAPVL